MEVVFVSFLHCEGTLSPPLTYCVVWFLFVFKILFLNILYTHHGVQTHNPEIKSHMLHQLNQPGSTILCFLEGNH